MDFSQLGPRRETLFKDAVLNAAESKGMDIIADAQRKAQQALNSAQALCEVADHALIAARMARDADKDHSAAAQKTRQELLLHRSEMVDGLFGELEERLRQFARSGDYAPWLLQRVKTHAAKAKDCKTVKVFVRKEDVLHRNDMRDLLPGCEVAEDGSIRLGGCKMQMDNVLYNETLDDKMEQEKEEFYKNSRLIL